MSAGAELPQSIRVIRTGCSDYDKVGYLTVVAVASTACQLDNSFCCCRRTGNTTIDSGTDWLSLVSAAAADQTGTTAATTC